MDLRNYRSWGILLLVVAVPCSAMLIIHNGLTSGWLVSWNSEGTKARVLLQDGRRFAPEEIKFLIERFTDQGIANVCEQNGCLEVDADDRNRCYEVLRAADLRNLKKKQSASAGFLPRSFQPPSEQARLARQEKIEKLRAILLRIEGIRDADIVHDESRGSSFKRDKIHSSVVTLWANEGHVIEHLHAATAKQLVQYSFAGMDETDVLVIDGDTGRTFDATRQSADEKMLARNQLDLESTRQQYVSHCRKLLSEFRTLDVRVQLALEKRILTPKPGSTRSLISVTAPVMEAVTNGEGKISVPNSSAGSSKSPAMTPRTVIIKRLLGVEVDISGEAVSDFLQRKLGVVARGSEPLSDQQFQRGVTAVRNEITKKVISWLRGKGIDFTSDLVSIKVIREPVEEPIVVDVSESNVSIQERWIWITACSCLSAFALALVVVWKKTSGRGKIRSGPESFSAAGRNFVTRNVATTGSVLTDEIQEVVQQDPDRSVAAFQDLVEGKADR